MWDGDTYREAIVSYIKENKIDISGRWNYQYGIFTGATLIFIYEMFRKYGIAPEKILAFDSFEGLPEEKADVPKSEVWQKKEFSMKNAFQTDDTNLIIQQIESKLPDRDIPIEWYEGFFSDVLLPKFMELQPKPAFWVDLDVDLYISTYQVLDFMFANKLILKNTIVSYDDWGGTEEFKGGESLAHKEMIEKYGVRFKEIHTVANGVHVQKGFIVL